MVRALHAGAVCSVVLRGAPVDAHDNDTICAPAARALAGGLAANMGTLSTLALTDMKLSAEGLRVMLHALRGSGALRRLDLSNLCSRWTVTNTLGRERGALLAELIRGWPGLEALVLADCTLAEGCAPVAAALRGLAALEEVDLTFNEMDEAAASVLARSLQGKPRLRSVALEGNALGPRARSAIKEVLRVVGKLS